MSGRATGDGPLEKLLGQAAGDETWITPARGGSAGHLMTQFNSLPNRHKERLLGYLDALSKDADRGSNV